MVHRRVRGDQVSEEALSIDVVEEVARLVARVHGLDTDWIRGIRERQRKRYAALEFVSFHADRQERILGPVCRPQHPWVMILYERAIGLHQVFIWIWKIHGNHLVFLQVWPRAVAHLTQ